MATKKITSFFAPVQAKRLKTAIAPPNDSTQQDENDPNSPQGEYGIGASWLPYLEAELNAEYFKKLQNFIEDERKKTTVFPPQKQVFSWSSYCGFQNVKVVILGQDPYHDNNQAHGLAFSVQRGIALPPSLRNIFKELSKDIEGFQTPGCGDLSGWAKQGVLLLNACLTVRAHQANSHRDKGWETFTDAVIHAVSTNLENIVFLLWGKDAQKKGSKIDINRHLVLKEVHPSPLSASRGFFGCRHFSKANEYLVKHGKTPIDWKALD